MQFPIEYVRIRSEMLGYFLNFLSACGALQFSPPPAIAPTIGSVSRDELLKCGRVVTQVKFSIYNFFKSWVIKHYVKTYCHLNVTGPYFYS